MAKRKAEGAKSGDAKKAKSNSGRKKAKRRAVVEGDIHIQTTFNNTIISVTSKTGDLIAWSSAGSHFKGAQKSTPFAAGVALEEAVAKARDEYGLKKVAVFIKGGGAGREIARNLNSLGIVVVLLKDVSGIAHNGCRKRGRRRV